MEVNLQNQIAYSQMNGTRAASSNAKSGSSNNVLEMDDFFKLLAAQLQNQDMMNPMDESAFMTQLTQMATVQAMTNMMDVSLTSYAASLVGKEVTVAKVGSKNEIIEIVGTVTGAGLYGGKQVIFVEGESYYLNQIMVVGRLPEKDDVSNEEKPEETKPPVDEETVEI